MNTQTALLRLCDDIRFGIDNHLVTIAVFFDFTKAFDSVNHHLLLLKLKQLNLSSSALKWFYSYLTGVRLPKLMNGHPLGRHQAAVFHKEVFSDRYYTQFL